MPRVSTPESEVAKLGATAQIEAHHSDEALLNELFALAELSHETVVGWAVTPAAARKKFLVERSAAVARGDALAARSPEEVSPLLRGEQAKACREWATAREALLGLG
jgi:hypothetical protein